MKKSVCIILFLLQITSIIYSRFVPFGYFNWAPFDAINIFTIETKVNGKLLTADQIHKRYRGVYKTGRNNRNILHIINILKQYEETYGKDDDAQIRMVYRINGSKEKVWQWPQ